MRIQMRAAHWAHHLILQFTDEDHEWFQERCWCDMELVRDGHNLLIMPGACGAKAGVDFQPSRYGEDHVRNPRWPWEMDFHATKQRGRFRTELGLPYFGLGEFVAEVGEDMMTVELGPRCHLPWMATNASLTAEEWLENFKERILSAHENQMEPLRMSKSVRKFYSHLWDRAYGELREAGLI